MNAAAARASISYRRKSKYSGERCYVYHAIKAMALSRS